MLIPGGMILVKEPMFDTPSTVKWEENRFRILRPRYQWLDLFHQAGLNPYYIEDGVDSDGFVGDACYVLISSPYTPRKKGASSGSPKVKFSKRTSQSTSRK